QVRRDPFAMLPFCGYHIADYFNHWLQMGRNLGNPPRMFFVNWFRKDKDGKFIWPGFGENMRVLQWIVDRVHGKGTAIESPLGWMPRYEEMDWTGLDFPREKFNELMTIDTRLWKNEALQHEELFDSIYDKLPKELFWIRQLLLSSLWRSGEKWLAGKVGVTTRASNE
ncbi:MAG: phosphoenolpyruvate carboxykinase domain-containing protein, partial [Leptospiraceae bacterium]|nr:phosphoenolpyruvate carboxykinase domain-containing protein [Leptospiraceae bacterium]